MAVTVGIAQLYLLGGANMYPMQHMVPSANISLPLNSILVSSAILQGSWSWPTTRTDHTMPRHISTVWIYALHVMLAKRRSNTYKHCACRCLTRLLFWSYSRMERIPPRKPQGTTEAGFLQAGHSYSHPTNSNSKQWHKYHQLDLILLWSTNYLPREKMLNFFYVSCLTPVAKNDTSTPFWQ